MPKLPRIMLFSDAPVSFGSRGNSEALARLFQHYSADRLTIVQTQGALPEPDCRIPNQVYHVRPVPWDMLLHTRLSVPANIMKAVYHGLTFRQFADDTKVDAPDAIIALVHGNGWVLARRIAERLKIPLHLIVHDGPDHFHLNYPISGSFMRKEFMLACRQASSRWSISAALDQYIEQMTGVPGDVLPPLRYAGDGTPSATPIDAPTTQAVYFGALSSISITKMMNAAASELVRLGGALHAYGGVSPNVAASAAWQERTFVHHGAFGDRNKFLAKCRQSYGLMYLPFSFEDEPIRFSFPSKLVDYTLVGLPIVVQAPFSSPVGTWCNEHSDAALFVGEQGPDALRAPMVALLSSAEARSRFAKGALEAGERNFDFETNWKRFIAAVSRGSSDKNITRSSSLR